MTGRTAPPLEIRPARPADRGPVLAFCRNTFSWGDYLDEVWDAWLADPRGLFAVGSAGDAIVGVDKLTFLSADEAFFEGLRINPAYRGRGYAQAFERHMLAEAARQGARVVRFLTAADNAAVHTIATRHGFQRGPVLRGWESPEVLPPGVTPRALVPPAPGPAAEAWRAALAAWPPEATTGPLVSHRWHVQELGPALWDTWLAAGTLLVPAGDPQAALVALAPGYDETWLAWIAASPFTAVPLAALIAGAQVVAAAQGRPRLRAELPRIPALEEALALAGWTAESEEGELFVFEATPEGAGES